MISVLYEVVVLLGFFLFLPKMLYQRVRYKKYKNFLARFGFAFKTIQPKDSGPIIWVHAVSVGESQAVSSVIQTLQKQIPNATIVVSSITETGHAEAKKTLPFADHHVFLPFDFYLSVKYVLSKCTPDMIILSEGDYWFRFLQESKKKGSVIVVVNGKISETSTKRMKYVQAFTTKLFSLIDFFCMQTEQYKERLCSLGVAASKIAVTGNVKCDSLPEPLTPAELDALRSKMKLSASDKVIVIGSTHSPEEASLLEQLAPLYKKYPNLKIVLAPRHPERFAEVAALIEKFGLSYSRWTDPEKTVNPQVFLLDAMGILRKAYQLADISIVAGSFIERVGGHNILEAQCFLKPVLVGPYMYTQPQLIESALYFDAIVQVAASDVGKTVDELMQDSARIKELSDNCAKMLQTMQGATLKTVESIHKLVPELFSK